MKNKILSLKKLKIEIKKQKFLGKKVVLCHGVFDLLHIGHINYFNEAKKFGDMLVVSVTPDKYINKGPDRPAFNLKIRIQAIASLGCVDYVTANFWPTAVEIIKILKPNFYVKGPDYKNNKNDITGRILDEKKAIETTGGQIKYTSGATFSSSNLLNNLSSIYTKEQKNFIHKIKAKTNFYDFKKKIKNLKNLKILVIGETIIDRYVFCETIGKSGKEPMLVLKEKLSKDFLGGAAAISKQICEFCESTTLISVLGEKKEYKQFVTRNLGKKVSTRFVYKKNSPTIIKKRYVDKVSNFKTLGVYSINDEYLNKKNKKEFLKMLKSEIKKQDIVIVSDYGHGFISKEVAKYISKESNFLTVNSQINANNQGHHTLDKYNNVDCVLINETEMRYELRDRESESKLLMKYLCDKLNAKSLIVTQGNEGAVYFNSKNKKFISCPAFAGSVVDKVGAGDAMLSLFSAGLYKSKLPELALFIGSLAAANSVKRFGNDKIVSKADLIKSAHYFFK